MKKILIVFLLAIAALPEMRAQSLCVASYNIRYDNDGDKKNGNGWQDRCPVICDQLNFIHPVAFGAQEVLDHQLKDMLAKLDNYGYVGVGRDDGNTAGEYAPIFYDKSRVKLLNKGWFWLSQTPEKPSFGWDAACIRICTWAELQLRGTKKRFFFFNLHMDHVGVKAREESARLVMQRIKKLAGTTPAILTGDFNVDQTNKIYSIFTESGLLKDSYANTRLRFCENGTYNAFNSQLKTESRIDHIFTTKQLKADRYGVLTNGYWKKNEHSDMKMKGQDAPREIDFSPYTLKLPSDHYLVVTYLNFR